VKKRAVVLAAGLLASLLAVSARAGIFVDIGSPTLSVGGTGYVDVMISSDTPGGDNLSAYGFDFRITTAGPTRLEFVSIGVDHHQLDPQLTDSRYVFFGNSTDQQLGFSVGAVNDLAVPPNSQYVGGDSTYLGNTITLTSTPQLLARLAVTANTTLAPQQGDTFTVSLDGGSSTFFLDGASAPITVSSTNSGTVTVPEPGTLISLGSGLVAALGYWLVRVRRRR
jgi:hypothetical protein